jgi:core-2/I-Branching enzyme
MNLNDARSPTLSVETQPRPNIDNIPYHEFVYLILSHGQADQIVRLIRTLRTASPHSAIVIHHDAKSPLPDLSRVTEAGGLYFVEPRIDVIWGDYSFLDATLTSLRYTQQTLNFSWISIISGQDYPLRPLAAIENELSSAQYDGFIKALPATDQHYAFRYYMNYRILPRFRYAHRIPGYLRAAFQRATHAFNHCQSLLRIEGGVRGTPKRLGLRALTHPFSDNFVCYKGSDWFTVSNRAVSYLLWFERERHDIISFYRKTYIPSESYIQTVLRNCRELRICDDNRRFISWDSSGSSHPRTLTIQDLNAITRSGKDFGRKFDSHTDSSILDALDSIILDSRATCITSK